MRAVLAALGVIVALPSAAQAATVSVSAPAGASGRTMTVTLQGATRVTVSRSGGDVFVAASPGDTLSQSGSGCSGLDGGYVCGAETSFARIVVNGSTGSDEIALSPSITRPATIDGNGGDDELAGGGGNDTIDGDNGNDVISGGAGNDTLDGAAGTDVLVGDAGNDVLDGGSGADAMSGGGQAGDTLDYSSRSGRVTVELGRVAPQGEPNENDEVDGFAVVLGGSGADTLTGTAANERLDGNGGADVLGGGAGNDTLNGGSGADAITGGPGADTLGGGDGDDALDARDGAADTAIACGGGRDRMANDAGDPAPADCEVVAPLVLGEIAVTGDAAVGGTLVATFAGRLAGTASAAAWLWARCTAAGCEAAGQGEAYAVTAADAGAQLVAVLRAQNEAGAAELLSAPVPIPVPLPAAPAPPPVPPAAVPTTAVRSLKCSRRRCRVVLTVTGAPASVRVALTRGGRTVGSATRKAPGARVTVTVKAKRTLKRGTYRLRVTAPGAKTVTRTVRVR